MNDVKLHTGFLFFCARPLSMPIHGGGIFGGLGINTERAQWAGLIQAAEIEPERIRVRWRWQSPGQRIQSGGNPIRAAVDQALAAKFGW